MNAPYRPVVDPEMLLETFDDPIVIPRAYIRLTGGIAPALFLSALVTLTQELPDQSQLAASERGWILLSQPQWEALTSLTRYEQESARRALEQRGFIHQERRGMPARLGIRLRAHKVAEALRQQAHATYGTYVSARRQHERASR